MNAMPWVQSLVTAPSRDEGKPINLFLFLLDLPAKQKRTYPRISAFKDSGKARKE